MRPAECFFRLTSVCHSLPVTAASNARLQRQSKKRPHLGIERWNYFLFARLFFVPRKQWADRSLAFRKCASCKSVSRTHFPFSTSPNWPPKPDFQSFGNVCSRRTFADFPVCNIKMLVKLSLEYIKHRMPHSLNVQRMTTLIMAVKPPKRRSERLSRRKSTLIIACIAFVSDR